MIAASSIAITHKLAGSMGYLWTNKSWGNPSIIAVVIALVDVYGRINMI